MLQMILYFLLGVTYTLVARSCWLASTRFFMAVTPEVVLTSYSADYLFIRRGQRSFYGCPTAIYLASGLSCCVLGGVVNGC